MGMPKISDQSKEMASVGEVQSKCVKSCSYHGECVHMEDARDKVDEKTSPTTRDASRERKTKSLNSLQKIEEQDTANLTKSKNDNVKIIVNRLKKQESKQKPVSCCEKKRSERTLSESTCKKQREKDAEKQDVVVITIHTAKTTASEELASGSVDRLQGILRPVAEKSGNEVSFSMDSKKGEDLKVPVVRMDRGSSPINLPLRTASSEKRKMTLSSETESVTINTVKDLKVAPEDDAITTTSICLEEFQPEDASMVPEEQSPVSQDKRLAPPAESDQLREEIHDEKIKSQKIVPIANVVESRAGRAPKLSIQVMPTVSIRGGLVMQKTLHLCIKPTGSMTNEIECGRNNVGYQEIKAHPDSEKESETGTCPDTCRSRYGPHCAAAGSHDPKNKRQSPIVLDKQTLFLYKSFQVLDEQIYEDRRRPTNVQSTESHDIPAKVGLGASTADSVDSIQDLKHLPRDQRAPWQLGLYKTKATQCHEHETSRDDTPVAARSRPPTPVPVVARTNSPEHATEAVESDKPIVTIDTHNTPSASSSSSVKKSSSSAHHSVRVARTDSPERAAEVVESDRTQKSVVTIDTHNTPSTSLSSLLKKSASSVRRSLSASSDTNVEPSKLTVQQIIQVLNEVTDASSRDIFQSPLREPEKPVKEAMTREQVKESRSKYSSSSSSSSGSSVSSYAVVGSVNEANSYRGRSSSRGGADSTVSPVKVIRANKNQEPDDVSNVKSETESSPSRKESGLKTDMSIQVSLEDSSADGSSTDSSLEEDKEETKTISYFIKGLTGTSREQLNKLRSSPSFPRSELATWSRGVLKTVHKEKSKTDHHEHDTELEVENLEYNDTNKSEGIETDSASILSERTKMKRLKELQQLASTESAVQPPHPDDRKDREDIVMRLQQHTRMSEGGDRSHLSKRHLPFYRRVLSRIIDPSNRKLMQKSLSEPYPIDETVSEGEISFKSKSHSIGEVNPYKYLEAKKYAKSELRHLKQKFGAAGRKDSGEKSVRVARDRTQYNNWVTYYLQKQQDKCVDDSGSTSAFSRSS